ncbi:MAG: alpha-amylase family glycosyl hydrolase, partial [Kiritimatiellae bacterium]|nr:alpha-amylase family glycosyl hydrolase [Kiritimatiellia bacterium]
WFHDFVRGVAPYRDYFIAVDPGADLSGVTRPRDLPLLTPVSTGRGEYHLWTTFSSDQLDLNYANPDVLFDMLDVLFQYIVQGASFIRMDAIAYLWKEIGTTCIHLPQTHQVVKLFRDVVDMIAPHVVLLTETNVPHVENVSYFGEGDEARMVYQFALPPLLLHTLIAEDAGPLTDWAAALQPPPEGCAFLNFTASHDGIGVRPLEGLLDAARIEALIQHAENRGGKVSRKQNSDGSKSAYELNITYYNALGTSDDDPHRDARFLCSQLIAMSLQGVPAVYFNSLLAAPNDDALVEATGRARSINRHKWTPDEILHALNNGSHPVFTRYIQALRIRRCQPAFSPQSPQQVLAPAPGVFALLRGEPGPGAVLCIFNVTSRSRVLPPFSRMAPAYHVESAVDLLSGKTLGAGQSVRLAPFQVRWLRLGSV